VRRLSLAILSIFLLCTTASFGADPAEQLLPFGLDAAEEMVVPAASLPHPVSRIAENVTVISAADIARLNAHTLDEILQTVPGFQLLQMQTPGTKVAFSLSGANSLHILVLIDGIPQNLLGAEDNAELGMIPVQRIERIEIIKGAASTTWGSALGGAINVITRSPAVGRRAGGMAVASSGEGSTSDFGAELSGTVARLGYYLQGGSYHSGGLQPDNRVDLDHAFGKLTYNLPVKGQLTLELDHRYGKQLRKEADLAPGIRQTAVSGSTYDSGLLQFHYPLRENLQLEMRGSYGQRDAWLRWEPTAPAPPVILNAKNRTHTSSADIRLFWGDRLTSLVAGLEYLHDGVTDSEPVQQFPFLNFKRSLDRYGAYLNGAYTFGPLTVLPGIRFDHSTIYDTITSYHLGATWKLTDKTLARLYGAYGYSQPMINFTDSLQHIRTVQVGLESNDLPYFWLKGTLFYSNTWNIQQFIVPPNWPNAPITTSSSEQHRQGFEVEMHTVPLYDISLRAGFTYTEVRDKATDALVNYIPVNLAKLAFRYDPVRLGMNATLTGNYVTWPKSTGNSIHDNAVAWDLHLNQRLHPSAEFSPELFLSIRNLFNGAQYIDDFRRNAPRWVEGGVRFRF